MGRFVFYLVIGYIVLKLVRVFIDPLFEPSENSRKQKQTPSPNNTEPKKTLGDYVDFEEVK